MKFGFICPQVPGHLNPLTTLARHLHMRNHDVVFLYSSGAAGLPFIPGEEEDVISERRAELSKKQGERSTSKALIGLRSSTKPVHSTMARVEIRSIFLGSK
jgi:zeaxanthin glucosyltransferase